MKRDFKRKAMRMIAALTLMAMITVAMPFQNSYMVYAFEDGLSEDEVFETELLSESDEEDLMSSDTLDSDDPDINADMMDDDESGIEEVLDDDSYESMEIEDDSEEDEFINTESEESSLTSEETEFFRSKRVNGVRVSVNAPAGVFPQDAILSVVAVSMNERKTVEKSVEQVRDDDAVVAVSYVFDIKILDAEGNELQPEDGQSVTISFETEEVADDNLDVSVYHIPDEGTAEELAVSVEDEKVISETEGFSYYTVEFTYNTLQYVMEGDTQVLLDDILDFIGLVGDVTDVECSNTELFSASLEDGVWMVTAHEAFSTEEWMKVTINGVVYEIVVTDAKNPYSGDMNSNCTYAAWQKTKERMGIELPSWGNAWQWYSGAQGAGFSVGSQPRANSIVVFRQASWNGYYGHVAFVTEYNSSTGKIYKLEGNYNGTYHEGWAPAYEPDMLGYIYLQQADTTRPEISNVKVSNITADGYTVTCNVSDNVGVTKVTFPTWTDNGGQDDLVWHEGTISSGVASCRINKSAHNNETGFYLTHIYADDAAGNSTCKNQVDYPELKVYIGDTVAPTISNVVVSDVSSTGFTITCDVSDNVGIIGVRFPTWTANDGQDDIIWYKGSVKNGKATCRINTRSHQGQAGCAYAVHIYADDYAGNSTRFVVPDVNVPSPISNIQFTDINGSGYTVTCNIDVNWGVKTIKFPTWTADNGQDDIRWYEVSLSGNTATYRIKTSDHNNEQNTTYITHIYVWDDSGNCCGERPEGIFVAADNVYAIKYELNGGVNNAENSQVYAKGTKVTLKAPTRDNYTFMGWYSDANFKKKVTTVSGGNKTVYAKWAANKYSIAFKGNGSTSGKMSKLANITYDEDRTLPANKFKKKGYDFIGWNTKSDGSGDFYNDKATVRGLSADNKATITLYAQWRIVNYTITYNLNGERAVNAAVNPAKYTVLDKIVFEKPTRQHYVFVGWYKNQKLTSKVTSIAKGSTGDRVLYAKWKPIKYTIVLDGNGATSGSMKKMTGMEWGKSKTLNANKFKKKGYDFVGWSFEPDGLLVYGDKAYVFNLCEENGGQITLYAKWEPKK